MFQIEPYVLIKILSYLLFPKNTSQKKKGVND